MRLTIPSLVALRTSRFASLSTFFFLVGFPIAFASDGFESVSNTPPTHEPLQSELICSDLPEEMQPENQLRDATRFAIDPIASAEKVYFLAGHRPDHFLPIAITFTLEGESLQPADFQMLTTTAPANADLEITRELVNALVGSTNEDARIRDLETMWRRIHEAYPPEDVEGDWACLRSRKANSEEVQVLLGHGTGSCGVLERAEGWDEAISLRSSQDWTLLSLTPIQGRTAVLERAHFTAPIYAIQEVDIASPSRTQPSG